MGACPGSVGYFGAFIDLNRLFGRLAHDVLPSVAGPLPAVTVACGSGLGRLWKALDRLVMASVARFLKGFTDFYSCLVGHFFAALSRRCSAAAGCSVISCRIQEISDCDLSLECRPTGGSSPAPCSPRRQPVSAHFCRVQAWPGAATVSQELPR